MNRVLEGERVAFTGKLASIGRKEALRRVKDAGGTPVENVSNRTSMLVIGAAGLPLLPDGNISHKLQQAEQLQKAGSKIHVASERAFLKRLNRSEEAESKSKSYSADQVCSLIGIDRQTLSRWDRSGLISSIDGGFDFQDLVSLRTIAGLVRDGVRPGTITRSLNRLSSFLPGTDRPLAQLRFVAESPRKLVAEIADRLLTPDGQLLLSLEGTGPSTQTVARLNFERTFSASEWLEQGEALADSERYDEAEDAFRKAIQADPAHAHAYFHLARTLRAKGRDQAAEELYRVAIAHDLNLVEAWFNLAHVLEEQNKKDEAIDCLRTCLQVDPQYADAHYNIALMLEETGKGREAATHWTAYLHLDPAGSWAAVARQHLANCS